MLVQDVIVLSLSLNKFKCKNRGTVGKKYSIKVISSHLDNFNDS